MAKPDDQNGTDVWGQLAKMSVGDVVSKLKEQRHDAWQEIFNAGHSTGHGKGRETQETLEAKLEESAAELTKAQGLIEKLQSQQPDVGKIHEQYKQELDSLKAKHREEMKRKDATIREREIERGKSSLRNALTKAGVDPDFAEVLVERDVVKSRLHVGEDFSLQIMQEGKEIPIQPAEGRTAVEHFAEELSKTVQSKFLTSSGDRGAGANRGGSPGRADFYSTLRERVQKERQASSPDNKRELLHRKLGIKSD